MNRQREEDWVYLDGRFCRRSQAYLPLENRSTLFSDSVYEVIRYAGGKGFCLTEHLHRLQYSMQAVQLPKPQMFRDLKKLSNQLVMQNGWQDAAVYWQVMRANTGPRRFQIDLDAPSTLFMFADPMPPLDSDAPVPAWRAMLTEDIRWGRCDVKSTMLLPASLAATQAKARGYDAAIFHRLGHMTEGFSFNVLAIKDKYIITHPANRRILTGITRNVVLKLAKHLGFIVEERPIPINRIDELDELIITSTTSVVTSIVQLDHHVIGLGKPGPVAADLRKSLMSLMLTEAI